MDERDRITKRIREIHTGGSWLGSSVHEVLAGVDHERASVRPIPNAHTIWEILLHMTAWVGEVRRRLDGAAPGLPQEGDWPAIAAGGAAGWERARAAHDAAHAALQAAIVACDAARFGAVMVRPDAPPRTYGAMLDGFVEHEAYHIGQMALLKKA
jgi:hypothetical protein